LLPAGRLWQALRAWSFGRRADLICMPSGFGIYLAGCCRALARAVNRGRLTGPAGAKVHLAGAGAYSKVFPMPLNKYSSPVTQPKSQGASQAMLYGTGLTAEDMQKPQVGIASVWYEGNTCNMHLNDLAAKVKEGVRAAGLVGMRFNTIGVSDGISMGTE